jgi:hypothetical protein
MAMIALRGPAPLQGQNSSSQHNSKSSWDAVLENIAKGIESLGENQRDVFFRGQASAEWSLQPSLGRLNQYQLSENFVTIQVKGWKLEKQA